MTEFKAVYVSACDAKKVKARLQVLEAVDEAIAKGYNKHMPSHLYVCCALTLPAMFSC